MSEEQRDEANGWPKLMLSAAECIC